MSFNSNGVPMTYPIGSIISYVGNADPDGWLICDGRAFTAVPNYNATIFTTLRSMLANSSTLPDLRNRTLVGGWLPSETRTFSANANTTYALKQNDLPSHFHNLSINNDQHANVKHLHNYNDLLHADGSSNDESPDTGDQSSYADRTISTNSTPHNHTLVNAFSSTGSGTEINFLNSCYTVNWIIKY